METVDNQGLIVVSKVDAVAIFTEPKGVEKILADIEAKIAVFVPDTSTAKGRKDIASMAYKVSQSKIILDALGKDLVTDWKQKSALVDASRKIARDRLDELRDKTREPLTIWEEAEEKRLAAEKLAREIETAHGEALTENDLFNRARDLAAREAELARADAERVAKEQAEVAKRLAEEEAVKAEAARIANEERIRKEAAEKAQREESEKAAAAIAEAERKAAEAQAAAEKAKAEQASAIAAAEERVRQEAARVEAERIAIEKAAAEKAEAERKEAERKAADVEHRRAINREAVDTLAENSGLTKAQAQSAIGAIVGGLVKNVSIKY